MLVAAMLKVVRNRGIGRCKGSIKSDESGMVGVC